MTANQLANPAINCQVVINKEQELVVCEKNIKMAKVYGRRTQMMTISQFVLWAR